MKVKQLIRRSVIAFLTVFSLVLGSMGFSSVFAAGTENVYQQVTKFTMGKTYLIVNVNDGKGVALTNNNSSSFSTTAVTVSGGKITVDSSTVEKAEWKAVEASEASEATLIGLKNGSQVLKVDGSSSSKPYIKTNGTSYFGGGFGYTSKNHVSYPYNKTDFYIGSTDDSFKASASETDLGTVYIFEKVESTEPTTEISITPVSTSSGTPPVVDATIAVGGTLTVHVTNSSTSSKYTFSTTFDKSGIAKANSESVEIASKGTEDVVITGVATGSVVVTIKNSNTYGDKYVRKATINLTVVETPTPPTPSGDTTYVAFSSDVHSNDSGLNSWIKNVSTKIGSKFDNMGFTGDLGPASGDFWTPAAKVIKVVEDSAYIDEDGFYVCGNHEYNPGSYTHNKNDTTKKYSDAGTYEIFDDYILYSVGAEQYNEIYSDATVNALKTFLEAHKDDGKPIFVLGHYPLHTFNGKTGESSSVHDGKAAQGSAKMIAAMNDYPNVVFLWGHNHSSNQEQYDIINTDSIGNTKINFTYAAAGCLAPDSYGSSKNVKGKGLVAAIDTENNKLTLTYYGIDGTVQGTPKTIDITGGKSEDVEVTPTAEDSPVINKTIKKGQSFKVKITNAGGSGYTFSTSFDPEDIASVDEEEIEIKSKETEEVVITGLAKGTTEITIQNDNQYSVRKATINLTVTDDTPEPTPTTKKVYTLTDKFVIGQKYLIVTVDDGEGVALTNTSSDSFGTKEVTVANKKIEASGLDKAVWEAKSTGTGEGLIGLYNGSNVLKVDASSTSNPFIKTSGTSYNAGGFGYTTSNHISYPYGSNPRNYYIGTEDDTFKASNTETGLGKVYIYAETEVPVEGNVVTFEMNGHGTQVPAQTVEEGGKAVKPDDPTAEGWTFKGWYADEELTEKFDFDEVIEENTTVYAKWSEVAGQTRTFDLVTEMGEGEYLIVSNGYALYNNNGKMSAVKVTVSEDGKKVTIDKDKIAGATWTFDDAEGEETSGDYEPTNGDYIFSRLSDASGEDQTAEITKDRPVSGNSGLPYYQWTYDATGFTLGQTGGQDKSATFYAFYNTEAGEFYTGTESETVKLYVVTEAEKFEVEFDMNGHGTQVSTQLVEDGDKAEKPEDPTAEGYAFEGWFEDEELSDEFDFDTAIHADTTIYAKWTSETPVTTEYTVKFEMNDHGTQVEDQKVKAGGCAEKPDDPEEEGWIFKGWFEDEDLETEFDFTTKINEDTTIYAKWSEVEPGTYYSVTFQMNGHGIQVSKQMVKEGECAVAPQTPTADGWKFDGWYADKDFKVAFDFSTKINADTVVYAKWTASSPVTGDNSKLALIFVIMVLSGFAITVSTVIISKRKRSR